MPSNFELYKNIHKGQRLEMARIAEMAGRAELEDRDGLSRLNSRVTAFREELLNHAHMEETFVHPVLAQRVPGGARKLEGDHAVMHQRMDDIAAMMEMITRSVPSPEGQAQLHELYLAWNRFIAFYLDHIDYEEEQAQPELWRLCTDAEVRGIFGQIIGAETPEQLAIDLALMLPAISRSDRVELAAPLSDSPPEVMRMFSGTAQRVLSADDYSDLRRRANLP